MKAEPRVYSYIRFSDAKQADGASVARQRDYAERWAQSNGLALDTSLSLRDEGLSAYHQRHVSKGALGTFLRAIEDGHIAEGSVLVVEGLDRLSRATPLDAMAQLTSIISAGVSVATACNDKLYSRERLKENPWDLLQSLLEMVRANEESATKSRRVTDAIVRLCDAWVAGTYRGTIAVGNTPSWLRLVDGAWQEVPERAAAVRMLVDLVLQGLGTGQVVLKLQEAGLAPSDAAPTSGHLTRLLAHPALVGEKHVTAGGRDFVLADYYPAMIDRETWDQLRAVRAGRSRAYVRSSLPSILTGFGVCFCGYCGAPMKSQNMTHKRRPDGTLADGHRRLNCSANNGSRCMVPGSCSAAPVERALVAWCADLMNLSMLYRGDATALPRAELDKARNRLAEIDRKLQRLTDAMLESDQPPAAFTQRARELQAERIQAQAGVSDAERMLAASSSAVLDGADRRWQAIAAGVEALEPEARATARRLVEQTFSRVAVYHHGLDPDGPRGHAQVISIMLVARGGGARLLTVARDGTLLHSADATAPVLDA